MSKRAAYKPPVGLRPPGLALQEAQAHESELSTQQAAEMLAMQNRHKAELVAARRAFADSRRREVMDAMVRYTEAGHAIPDVWLEELQKWQKGLP